MKLKLSPDALNWSIASAIFLMAYAVVDVAIFFATSYPRMAGRAFAIGLASLSILIIKKCCVDNTAWTARLHRRLTGHKDTP